MSAPLDNLRAYGTLAPWSVQSFVGLLRAVLASAAVHPTSGTATSSPTVRTLRYYVARNLIDHPEGNGPAATYGYRHFLQFLMIKVRQMEGANLKRIAQEVNATAGDALERRVATALGSTLPHPSELPLESAPASGRVAQAVHQWQTGTPTEPSASVFARWHRVEVSEGIELHVHEGHPLADRLEDTPRLAEALRRALRQFSRPAP